MRILIDLQCCQSGSRHGGIGRYSMALARAMLKLDSEHDFCILLNSRLPHENAIRADFADLLPQQKILTFDIPQYIAAEHDAPAHTRMAELIREKFIADIDPDLVHIASLFEGTGEDVVTSVGMLFPADRTAVTLYDLVPYLEREKYLKRQIQADHYFRAFEGLKRAGMVVSISEYSHLEALECAEIPTERIINISSAVDGKFAPIEIAAASRDKLLQRFGINKPFLMFTGSFDTRKNHERLVEAFAKVPATLRDQFQLVIIGKGEGRQLFQLRAVAEKHGLGREALVFVGHVTDADLITLYNLCTLFVFPSLREGFGLPVLEAMSCGAPTIGSNRTSIPEVIGREDALFNPEDVVDIAAKITKALGDLSFRDELRQHGLERAKNFSWELCAKRALEHFEHRMNSLRNHCDLKKANDEYTVRIGNALIWPRMNVTQKPSEERGQLQTVRPEPDVGLAPISQSSVTVQRTQTDETYQCFLQAIRDFNFPPFSDEFANAAAHAVAANERLTCAQYEDDWRELNVGWITTWNSECEIAAYSRQIIESVALRPRVFASCSRQMLSIEGVDSIPCWERGGHDDLLRLQTALAALPLEVVVIQCDGGIFDYLALSQLITKQKELGRYVFITLHSTKDLPALASGADAVTLRAALRGCNGVFVQSMIDVQNLEAIQVRKNVHFIPGVNTPFGEAAAAVDINLSAHYFMQKIMFAIMNT